MITSLRWRLFAILAVSVVFAWIATAFFTYQDARREIGLMLDARLVSVAELASTHFVNLDSIASTPQQIHDYTDTTLQVWQQDGTLLLNSNTAPAKRLGTQYQGFENITLQGVPYRIYSHWDSTHKINVRVGERYQLRNALAESVASHLLHPLYFAIPALGVLIWLAVGAGLVPLSRFAREVQQREPDKLEPLDLVGTPREVLPLQNALNALFSRLQNSLEHERRFTSDAAHELRTPLAAIKTQAQVAYAARDTAQFQQALNQVIHGVDRTAHLLEQLLMLSRLDPEKTPMDLQQVNLSTVANECVAVYAPQALHKDIDLGFEGGADAWVCGDTDLLTMLVRNLVDNAIRYTPAGGRVDVQVHPQADQVLLKVSDTGPGIPEQERKAVVSRFYRILGSGEQGSGLGLSIVQRIAQLHGATLGFEDNATGVGVVATVRFNVLLV